ncbi:alpha/beta hydrolase [Tateyamaria omphalii]|uniref:alpha/beta fold hydrolase n=1 Tax=Tateyamaria omphalii TaxID=299262 RepID=UPI001C9A1CA8|nr:alpha/beta hydrolase [Tateyamaria omphalii]MBY5934095.1 alpha/beta hydrolase [Tateyamaria omphalii]
MSRIQFRHGIPGVVPSAWVIHPDAGSRAVAPVVAVHGLNRETEVMANLLAPRADATGRTIVLPIFDRTSWRRYQRAACAQRSDWALIALLDALRDERVIQGGPPDLSGFSGGAQFAHRFAWLHPDQVARLCLVAPGWWTFPDARGAFPLAIGTGCNGQSFRLRANIKRFLDRQMHVSVGALDVKQDRNLRQDAEVVALQGANRVERARRWTAAAIRAARRVGVAPRISFDLMAHCVHSFSDCVANARLDRAFVPDFTPQLQTNQPPFRGHDQLGKVA